VFSGSIPGSEYKKDFNSFYKGIVVKNNDPDQMLRCKIYIPDLSNIPLTTLQEFKSISFKFPGKNNTQDNWSDTKLFEEMAKDLPWAEQCSSLMGEHGPGRYYAPEGTAVMTDTDYPDGFETNNTTPPTLEDYTGPPSFFFGLEGASNDAFDGSNEFVASNPYTDMYTPQNYENAPKGVVGVPMVGAQVWVFLYKGDLNFPVYFGGRFNSRETALIYNSTGEEGQSFDYPDTFENVPQQNQGTGSGSGSGSEEDPWYERDGGQPNPEVPTESLSRVPSLVGGDTGAPYEAVGPPDPKTLPRVTTESLEYGSPEYIIKRLKDQGLSETAAIGVVGNLQVESGLDPTIKQVSNTPGKFGPGRGLAQWEVGGRFDTDRVNLLKYAKERGTEWTDLDTQIDFIMYEMRDPSNRLGKAKIKLNDATTIQESTEIFLRDFERANWEKSHPDRRQKASQKYKDTIETIPYF